MDAGSIIFHFLIGVPAAMIAVVCLCRAAKLDARARWEVKATLILLAMSSFGTLFSMFMPHWLAAACLIGLTWSVCLMLIEGEKRWRQGPPDELLRDSERYPNTERRASERRQLFNTHPQGGT